MAKMFEVEVAADAEELHQFLRGKMAHVERVSEDVFASEGNYAAVMMYEQYFMRVGNQASLLVLVEAIGPEQARLKTVSCGTSQGMFFKLDWGAAGAFAEEPIRHARSRYMILRE